MKFLTLGMLSFIFVGCATLPKEASDLKIGGEYVTVSAPEPFSTCTVTVTDINTTMGTPAGRVMLKELADFDALVCGTVDRCEALPEPIFRCMPIDSLKAK